MPRFLRRLFSDKGTTHAKKETSSVPCHLAIIMDGNGRWAAQRKLPRTAGHQAGIVALRRTIKHANEMGISILTVYAFSTENWKRPKPEVDFLLRLPNEFLKSDLDNLHKKNIKVMMIGFMEGLPRHTRNAVSEAVEITAKNTGMVLNFALNYGSRDEIIAAVRAITQKVADGEVNPAQIDEQIISSHLFTAALPDPDLLIRPSGEIRLSNFLLWQLAYTELWFTEVNWPDFDREHLEEAISAYRNRDRRFGGIKL
ncbi:MAG: isoprenyl transferase [Dethiobacter sp.]|jgi:undecaprenyl diphosphate synthase|nr:isoprenyl transferase [Dethiobacter sp.]MBS3897923.1 isoprenyl transferase [Dethiobacter sp.]MBS3982236.1 isoprenyl transferase [Dethiobacter sp.]MCL4462976.1 isoprenyl transferase [Bacillota bacterium]MCL5993211.1 isoprenyl transferase [Bacillota bacterium]